MAKISLASKDKEEALTPVSPSNKSKKLTGKMITLCYLEQVTLMKDKSGGDPVTLQNSKYEPI